MAIETFPLESTQDRQYCYKINEIIDLLNSGALCNTVFDDFTVSGFALGGGPNEPTLTAFRGGIYLPAFAGTGPQLNEGFFTIHLLHGLKQGSSPTFHVHWAHNTASPTGNVKWQLEYSIARGYGVGTYPASTTLTTTRPALAQYVHDISDDDDMVLTNSVEVEPDSVIIGRLFRDQTDAADTFDNPAFLIQVDMHYERSHIGTTERNREWTSTGY